MYYYFIIYVAEYYMYRKVCLGLFLYFVFRKVC